MIASWKWLFIFLNILFWAPMVGCSETSEKPSPALTDDAKAVGSQKTGVKPEANQPTKPLIEIFARPAFARTGVKEGSLSDIAESAVKSVVNVAATRLTAPRRTSPYTDHPFFRQFRRRAPERKGQSLGSGVIVSTDGLILTNNHVIAKAASIRVKLYDGSEWQATLVGSDPKSDIAVLRLSKLPAKLFPIRFADSSKVRLGQVVLAIGNPFGFGQTVTMGIISATGRANVGIVDYEDFLQTDAAINPGNSGGALVDMRGRLIGINTAILSKSGGYQGIGFAVPTGMAKPIMESLVKHGKVVRGWLGVMIQTLSRELADAMKLSVQRGVIVSGVEPDSPAAKAGLKRGDVIVALDGKPLDSVPRLRSWVASRGAGAQIRLRLLRDNKPTEIAVTLGELPDQVARLGPSQGTLGGLTVETLDDNWRRKIGLPSRMRGVVVTELLPASRAYQAGLRSGDIILELNRLPMADSLRFYTHYKRAKGKLLLLVFREGSTLYLLLEK
jgi:serine protease Do